jgi:peptidoglycan hydrolase-like protein with peptidoglycan-binding domain
MWLERAREILALKEAGDIAILAGAAVTAFGLSFALPLARETTADVAEQGAVVISVAQRLPVPMPKPAVSRHAVEPAPGAPGDTASLSRQLQSELKRVGCYDGDVHGVWSKSTRAAMKAFTDRVNARLPVDKPDHILLALLQGHQGRACAVACSEGPAAHADARCVPEATLAKASHKPDTAELLPPKVADAPVIIPPVPVAALRPPRPASPPGEARAAPSPRLARDEPPPPRPLPDAIRPPDRAEPAPSADREKHAERDRGPVPAAGMRNGRGRSYTRSASYRQVRYARAIYRNLKRATLGALPFP